MHHGGGPTLRANAPDFVPVIAIKEEDTTPRQQLLNDGSQPKNNRRLRIRRPRKPHIHIHNHNDVTDSEAAQDQSQSQQRSSDRNNSRRRTTKSQQIPSRESSSQNDDPASSPAPPKDATRRRHRRPNNNNKEHSTCNNTKPSRRNHRRDGKKELHNQSTTRVEKPLVRVEDYSTEQEATLLLESSFFPSLPLEGSKNGTSTADSATSKEWVRSGNLNHVLRPPVDNHQPSPEDDEWFGLQKLAPNCPPKTRKLPLYESYSANNEDGIDEAVCSLPEAAATLEGELELSASIRRPKINMTRLRDRLWDRLALRRNRAMLQQELQSVLLKGRKIVDVEGHNNGKVDDDDDASSSHSIGTSTHDEQMPGLIEELEVDTDDQRQTAALNRLLGGSGNEKEPLSNTSSILWSAIESNDQDALRALLTLANNNEESSLVGHAINDELFANVETATEPMLEQAVRIAVEMDRPQILRTILTFVKQRTRITTSKVRLQQQQQSGQMKTSTTPLMFAAENGHEECLSLLISHAENVAVLLSCRDSFGNNVFHYCCRGGSADELSLQLLLKQVTGTTKAQQQQLSKLLMARNDSKQTPLQVACQHGRVDFVEAFLSSCNTALLSKLLAMSDSSNQTPLLAAVASNAPNVVMSLIMWRGNHHHLLRTTFQAPSSNINLVLAAGPNKDNNSNAQFPSCPLVWASKAGNLDMILLLLEFSDPSGNEYNTTKALHASLLLPASSESKSDCVRVLVQAGANPFEEVNPLQGSGEPTSAVSLASNNLGYIDTLSVLVNTGRREVKERQSRRRRDPVLQQQPESFFEAMETKENVEMLKALSDSLVEALFFGYHGSLDDNGQSDTSIRLAAAAMLYRLGAQLRDKDLVRLRSSLASGKIKPEIVISDQDKRRTFLATYMHPVDPKNTTSKVSDMDRSALAYWSRALFKLPWMQQLKRESTGSVCSFIDTARKVPDSIPPNEDLFSLVTDGGVQFLAHGPILSQKSAKLAAAVRFATMNQTEANDGLTEIPVSIDPRLCQLMLQHMYHGSISFGWSRSSEQNTRDILELLFVAEEFLCPSLVQECEMRLLSASPTSCFCWSCAKAVRPVEYNEKLVECMYHVDGSCQLVTAKTALDILAVLEHLETMEMEYSLHVTAVPSSVMAYVQPSQAWSCFDKKSWKSTRAIVSLKDSAICAILNAFCVVLESDAYRESIEVNEMDNSDNPSEDMPPEGLLLQMCLEELAASPLSTSDERCKMKPKS